MLSITFTHRCWNEEKHDIKDKDLLIYQMDSKQFEDYICEKEDSLIMEFITQNSTTSFTSNSKQDIIKIFNVVNFDLCVKGEDCGLEQYTYLISKVKIVKL